MVLDKAKHRPAQYAGLKEQIALDKEVEELRGKLVSVARQNAQLASHIKQLEKDFVEVKYEEPLDITAEEAVEIAEELLKDEKEGQ